MSSCSFKNTPIILMMLGLTWGILEFVIDISVMRNNDSLRALFVYHLGMGFLFVCLIMLTYWNNKNTKEQCSRELFSSEQRYAMIFNNSPLGIIHCGHDGIITDCNDSFLHILGAARAQILGFNIMSNIKDPEMKECLQSALTGAIGYYEGNYTCIISGKTILLKAIFRSLFYENGEFGGCIGIFEDIAEKKQIEKEMARLDRLDLVGQMSASIGHEIRNPMTTVRGFLQLLDKQETNSAKKEYYEIMITELDRANTIISEFLSLAKNKMVKFENISINDVIDTIHPLIMVESIKHEKNLFIKKGVIPKIPLDEREIRQLILNLVRNGLEAMPKGKDLLLRTYVAGNDLVLAVQDEGSGISTDLIDRIGTPFLTTKETGTGLGLPVCYSIAERHKAKIDFKTGSSGTTFYVRFRIPTNQSGTQKAV